MELTSQPEIELPAPTPIRVETALSRYPVHRLAKHGDIAIDIREKNSTGEMSIRWEVDCSKKHGQPGPLAYKLDTLIINRRIEEATRPIPRIIKLGSLRDICRELGLSEGENVNMIRKALRQNAFAGITAKMSYRKQDGTEQELEADFTRYSVVFTGEKLPDGRKADAVYIVLNDIYMQVINGAMTRPLDYDYLRNLPPAAQRFYELLSFQMYAAVKHNRGRARLEILRTLHLRPACPAIRLERRPPATGPHSRPAQEIRLYRRDQLSGDDRRRRQTGLDDALSARPEGPGGVSGIHQTRRPGDARGRAGHARPGAPTLPARRLLPALAAGAGVDRSRRHRHRGPPAGGRVSRGNHPPTD